jgi:hypothetical protein
MFGLTMNSLYKYNLLKPLEFVLVTRFSHSHIIYNELTKSLLIDNSLKKELELLERRRRRNKNIKDNKNVKDTIQTIEMSESHAIEPYKKKK